MSEPERPESAVTEPEMSAVATVRCPTIAELLDLRVLARGLPRVVAGHDRLDRRVRWVHVTEWASPAAALRGGELVLTTGIGFPDTLDGYAAELADVGAAGVVLELGRRYREVPRELLEGCRTRGIPLIVLYRGVKFVDVTQEVHTRIHSDQLRSLSEAQRIHDTFTNLTLRGADAEEIVRAAATMTGRSVVLENLLHQAVICRSAQRNLEDVLNRWEHRSRATRSPTGRTDVCGPEGWLLTSVELRGQRWARLVMLPGSTEEREFHAEHIMVVERAAVALTIARLTHETSWERQAHRTALRDLVEQRHGSTSDARARVEALGIPTRGRWLLVVWIRGGASAPELAEQLAESLNAVSALVGDLGNGQLGILLALKRAEDSRSVIERISRFAREVATDSTVSAGSEVPDLSEVARSFREAEQVANAIPPGSRTKSYYEHSDIGLPELLYALRDDLQVQAFAERQLGPLVDHDAKHGTDLLSSLRHYLNAAGNKSIAAKRGHLSRQAFYQRLHGIEQILGCDLEDGAQRAQLHVALTALDAHRH